MNNAMHLSFQVKSSKKNEFGKAPIYARITINEVRTEFSTKRFIEPEKWVNKAGYAQGNTEDIKTLNAHIAAVRTQLFQHHDKLLQAGKAVTVESVFYRRKCADMGLQPTHDLFQLFRYQGNPIQQKLDELLNA